MNSRTARPLIAALWCGVMLPSCATLGGNVKGSFACAAPDGTCAPTSAIDDGALALIATAGPAADGVAGVRPGRIAAAARRTMEAPSAARTGDKVLRVVLPAYIDDESRLHEASAIHVVVERGEWREALPAAQSTPVISAMPAPALLTPAALGAQPTASQPPSPEAVAAARARLNPNALIRADVDRRLAIGARGKGARPARGPAPTALATAPSASTPRAKVAAPAGSPVTRAPSFPVPGDGGKEP